MKELDVVVLTCDIDTDESEEPLKAGDVGTIVHVFRGGAAYEVEFVTLDGHTTGVVTLSAGQVKSVTPGTMMHAREPAHQVPAV